MRHLTLVGISFILLVLITSGQTVAARDATPAASPALTGATGPEEVVRFEPIAGGVAQILPPAPATLQLFRIHLAPGGSFSEPDGDPGTGIILVESGALTLSVTRPATLTRASGAEETMTASTEVALKPGDSVLGPSGAGGTFRNDGADETVVLVAAVRPLESAAAATPEG
jgi:hypothetical protein